MSDEAIRKAFELWMVNEAKFIVGSADPYPSGVERDWWRVWQAATRAAAPAWLPIETAPRGSGEEGPGSTAHPDYVRPPHLLLLTVEGPTVGYYDWYYHPGYGRGADPGESVWRGDNGSIFGPTHWMPLPAAPEAKP